METHKHIHLFLNRDPVGIESTRKALKSSFRYIDESHIYSNYKDLNECIVRMNSSRLLLNKMNSISINNQIKTNRHGRI
jgi:hypothetical protein